MRRILVGGVFALVIGTLLTGVANAQVPVYNMHCMRVFTGGGDPAPQTNNGNYAAPDGAMVSFSSQNQAGTPGTGLLVTGSPTVIDEVQAISGSSVTANDGTWLASTTTEAQANCFAPVGADVYVPQIQNEVSVNLAASGPSFATTCTNAWYDEAFTYSAYVASDPYVTSSFGTLYGTLYLMASGSPADGDVSGGLELVAGIRGSSEINALSAGTSGWWISGSYRQDTIGNFSGSVPPVLRPPVQLGFGVPPTFQVMVFPTEWVFEGDTIPIYGLVALPVAFAPISPASGGGVNYLLDFQSNAWFEIKVDPN